MLGPLSFLGSLGETGSFAWHGPLVDNGSLRSDGTLCNLGSLTFYGVLQSIGSLELLGALRTLGSLPHGRCCPQLRLAHSRRYPLLVNGSLDSDGTLMLIDSLCSYGTRVM
jgi:hypothetical protein